MDRNDLRRELRAMLNGLCGEDVFLDPAADLLETGLLDSLARVEWLELLEDRFGSRPSRRRSRRRYGAGPKRWLRSARIITLRTIPPVPASAEAKSEGSAPRRPDSKRPAPKPESAPRPTARRTAAPSARSSL